MSNKMYILFVVYVCILQCQLFEFRSIKDPVQHIHHTSHNDGLRAARSAHSHTILLTLAPSGNTATIKSVVLTNASIPIKANESIPESNPTENTIVEYPNNVIQETSQIEDMIVEAINANNTILAKTEDDKLPISLSQKEKPTSDDVFEAKSTKPESGQILSAPKNNDEPSKTKINPEGDLATLNKEEIEVPSVQTAYSNEDDITQKSSQQSEKETEEKPIIPTDVLRKSTSDNAPATANNVEIKEASSADTVLAKDKQDTTGIGSENIKTVTVEKEISKENDVVHDTMELDSAVKSGNENIPEGSNSTSDSE